MVTYGGTNMEDLDSVLSVIENPARRQILEALVREPHYPLQLSKELGISQQAIVKHLKVLEDNGIVGTYTEKSDLQGPQRKKYYLVQAFSIVVDLTPNLFNVELITRSQLDNHEPVENGCQDLSEIRDRMKKIDEELSHLNSKRDELLVEKEELLQLARDTTASIPSYTTRKIVHELLMHPECNINDIARKISLRDDVVLDYLQKWLEEEF